MEPVAGVMWAAHFVIKQASLEQALEALADVRCGSAAPSIGQRLPRDATTWRRLVEHQRQIEAVGDRVTSESMPVGQQIRQQFGEFHGDAPVARGGRVSSALISRRLD